METSGLKTLNLSHQEWHELALLTVKGVIKDDNNDILRVPIKSISRQDKATSRGVSMYFRFRITIK